MAKSITMRGLIPLRGGRRMVTEHYPIIDNMVHESVRFNHEIFPSL